MTAQLDHESFPQPPNPEVPLWRYMDLSKFAALLQKRALIFARGDQLGDPFEGSIPLPNARFPEALIALRQAAPDLDPYKDLPIEAVLSMTKTSSELRWRMVKSVYVSCWHMNEAESAAMWKVYSKSDDAVCVLTDYKTLSEALPDDSMLGTVQYVDFKKHQLKEGNAFNALMIKRLSFAHEREARAVIWKPEMIEPNAPLGPLIIHVDVDLAQLIKLIYVSPQSPDWFRDVVADLVTTYGLEVKVEHSEMNAEPLF